MVKTACNTGDADSIPGSGRSLEKEMATFPGFLPGKSQGERSLVGYTSFVTKELDMT